MFTNVKREAETGTGVCLNGICANTGPLDPALGAPGSGVLQVPHVDGTQYSPLGWSAYDSHGNEYLFSLTSYYGSNGGAYLIPTQCCGSNSLFSLLTNFTYYLNVTSGTPSTTSSGVTSSPSSTPLYSSTIFPLTFLGQIQSSSVDGTIVFHQAQVVGTITQTTGDITIQATLVLGTGNPPVTLPTLMFLILLNDSLAGNDLVATESPPFSYTLQNRCPAQLSGLEWNSMILLSTFSHTSTLKILTSNDVYTAGLSWNSLGNAQINSFELINCGFFPLTYYTFNSSLAVATISPALPLTDSLTITSMSGNCYIVLYSIGPLVRNLGLTLPGTSDGFFYLCALFLDGTSLPCSYTTEA